MIGRYPTPVEKLDALSTGASELWVKRDDRSGEAYGGNKIRKLERILEQAKRKGARRILTVGAAGSHHVLATTLHGTRMGLRVGAVLTPQPRTPHVVDNLRAAVGLGLEAYAARSIVDVARRVVEVRERGDLLVPPGGSNLTGTQGYIDAAHELALDIREGRLPSPDAIVVALGSGGTAAGILAGLVHEGLSARLVAVRIVEPVLSGRWRLLALAMAASRAASISVQPVRLARQLEVDGRWLGAGYGHPTEAGERALAIAKEQGLKLDPTYTAKTFAAALDLVASGKYRRVLYWHTLSSAPLEPLLENAPREDELPAELRALFVVAKRS